MSFNSERELLESLLQANSPSDVEEVLNEAGDSADLNEDDEFGDLGLKWRFYGDSSSNMSTINMSTEPGRSLIERVTNAIDAILEREMHQRGGEEPDSPAEAAKKWFGRPPSTTDSGIFSWNYNADYDRNIHVSLLDGDDEAKPTIDIKDSGIGIKPEDFPETILSLQAGNKIKKNYLAGAFGQGGSTTFSFCDYTLIVSRHIDDPERVGFTVVRLMELSEEWDENAWVYLSTEDGVPSCEVDGDLELYTENENDKKESLKNLSHGTLVRHFGYRLEDYNSTLSPASTNLYHFLHRMMFDPLLPFRVVDLREGRYKDELVTGTRNRLMKLRDQEVDEGDSGTEVVHYQPKEMISPLSRSEPSVGVEYWVIFHWREKKDRMRSWSNNTFVEKRHPILGTLNGQNQGEMTSRPIRELDLSMVAKHIVVHIDATDANKEVRRSLFASTREGFKDDIALDAIIDLLQQRMEEDERLNDIERILIDDLLTEETEETDEEVKNEISQLLQESGFEVGEQGIVNEFGDEGNDNGNGGGGGGGGGSTPDPIQTQPFPQVTRFEIVYPDDNLDVPEGGDLTRRVRIETDANYRYDREGRISLRTEPSIVEIASETELEEGHKYWRLRSTEDANIGDEGEIIVTLTRPNGAQIEERVDVEIVERPSTGEDTTKGRVPAFDIIKVDPEENPDQFHKIWPDVNEDEIPQIAYKPQSTEDGVIVFYSTSFGPFKEVIEDIKQKTSLAELFRKNYEVWIGYHAILQHQESEEIRSDEDLDISEEQIENVQERERALVAVMQAKQAVQTAETQQDAISAKASS